MGFAIAERLACLGAKVLLVTGPVNLNCEHPNINRINITSANEMYDVCLNLFNSTNGAIMVSAVADYAPIKAEEQKLKRSGENLMIELRPNPDIAASLGLIKRPDQLLAGFALETNEERPNALSKLKKKNLDFIVINSLRDGGSGFQYDTNKISILDNKGKIMEFGLKPKKEVAVDIVNKLIEMQELLPTLI
jgi:phosphopantothenoylcysteine decarboxylase/phosphopantothenate--cysteine ligase